MTTYIFSTADQVAQVYGEPRLALRKTLVTTRAIAGETERFATRMGELVGHQADDLVVVPTDGGSPYPCKTSIFQQSWIETEPGSGVYRRKALARLVPVPQGDEVIVRSLEGDLTIRHPDFIALGVQGEVYANSADWVAENLEFLPHQEAV
ncbi:MAG: hypothetical protein VKI42_06440 [Synechococcaceae cyanobacterium]|nr:hypothetical protein [Synechococcaceae cyanobacterium]